MDNNESSAKIPRPVTVSYWLFRLALSEMRSTVGIQCKSTELMSELCVIIRKILNVTHTKNEFFCIKLCAKVAVE